MTISDKYPLALPEGTVLAGQYIITGVLGQGGFGITYQAQDHKRDIRVAIKEFFPDSMATRSQGQTTVMPYTGDRGDNFEYGKQCFLQEAETLAQFIGNDNIVRIYSYFEEYGTAYFVMDYIEGKSLEDHIKENGGKLSFEEASEILLPVMDALGAVHEKGIVHRDVAPDNIYLTKDGEVKLLDFGAARQSLGDKSQSLDVVLKHGFAPKEQYTRRGRQGPYTDVYAFGATFYFALTGKRPPDSLERIDEDDIVLPSTLGVKIPKNAEEALMKALNVRAEDRYQSMAAFKNAFVDIQSASPETRDISTSTRAYNDSNNKGTINNEYIFEPSQQSKVNSKKRNVVIIVASICAVLIIIILILGLGSSKTTKNIQGETISQNIDEELTESNPSSEEIDSYNATESQADPQEDVGVNTPTPLPSDSNNKGTIEAESPFAEGFPSQTIYEEDGVAMTFVGFASDFSTMTLRFENNNPDNKKASFWNLIYSLDGVWDGGTSHNKEIVDMLAGESEEFEVELEETLKARNKDYSTLGAPEFPLEMASFFFEFRVGNESEHQFLSCPIYFDAYKEGDLEQYYGEKVATVGTGFDPNYEKKFDLYVKMDGDKAIAVFANQRGEGDIGYMPENNWSINGKGVSGSGFTCSIIGEGFISINTFRVDPNYRRKNEIPNGTPLDISIYFQIFLNDYEYPVGTVE